METREMNVWLNREEVRKFEAFLGSLKLDEKNKFILRLVDEPGIVYKTYEPKLIELAEKTIKYYVFEIGE